MPRTRRRAPVSSPPGPAPDDSIFGAEHVLSSPESSRSKTPHTLSRAFAILFMATMGLLGTADGLRSSFAANRAALLLLELSTHRLASDRSAAARGVATWFAADSVDSQALLRARDLWRTALKASPPNRQWEQRIVELEFARGQWDAAAVSMGLIQGSERPLQQSLVSANWAYQLLDSRLREWSGDLTGAIVACTTGLRHGATVLPLQLREMEVRRLVWLYARDAATAAEPDKAASLHRAALYGAAAGEWSEAHLAAAQLLRDPRYVRFVSMRDHALLELIVAFDAASEQGPGAHAPQAPLPGTYREHPYLRLGRYLHSYGAPLAWRGAFDAFVAHAAVVPAAAEGAYLAAQVLTEQGAGTYAIPYYRMAAARDSLNSQYAFALGWAMVSAGETREGVIWLQRAFGLQPSAYVAARAAQVLEQLGDHRAAIDYANYSMELPPEDSWVRFWVGRVYWLNGKRDAALRAFSAAVVIDTTNTEAANALCVARGAGED